MQIEVTAWMIRLLIPPQAACEICDKPLAAESRVRRTVLIASFDGAIELRVCVQCHRDIHGHV